MMQKVPGSTMVRPAGSWKTRSVYPAVNGFFFDQRRIKQRKDRDGLRLSCTAPVIQ